MKLIKIFYYIGPLIRIKNLKIQKNRLKFFSKNNLDYLEGKNKLENVLKEIDIEKYKMSSEHLKIFLQ